MAKKTEQKEFDFKDKKENGPVECLGMTFENNNQRRIFFIEKLKEKLKNPEFRKIDGFPIGEDEDILALSDPPYYTACPNPWIGDFIKEWESQKPEKPEDYNYHREPFAADVREGKNDPIYNAHSYHTKVPYKAIMRYILHYTEPGDIMFDGFCGTGMTGVAAQMCGDKNVIMELGYQVKPDGVILQEETDEDGKKKWIAFSKIGVRKVILNDLAPSATFIAYNYNTPINCAVFEKEANRILNLLKKEYGWLYETRHTDGRIGKINYTVWSDLFICPECQTEINFWDETVNTQTNVVKDNFECPECSSILNKKKIEQKFETIIDIETGDAISIAKQVPVLINYSIGKKRFEKILDDADFDNIKSCIELSGSGKHPSIPLPDGYNLNQPKRSHGFIYTHHFYSRRALVCLDSFFEKCNGPYLRQLNFLMGSVLPKLTKLNRYMRQHGSRALVGPMPNALYVPPISVENNVIGQFEFQLKKIVKAFFSSQECSAIATISSTKLEISENSMDYIFLDPPFGGNIMYSDMSFLRESWLRIRTNIKEEAIENNVQGKELKDYKDLMQKCFSEAYRILRPGRWMTVEFSNTKASVWNVLQTSLQETGFVVANVAGLDKTRGGYHSMIGPTAVKQDLVISAYKPNGGLEKRFLKKAETEEGVWDFIQAHLKNLPVVKVKGGQLEFISERDPRILFDRTVAFYVQHGIPVPISSPEFQASLADKFPERDGMYFLPEQAAEYDKKRIKMEGLGQMTLFVDDERSAIDWLRQFLKNKPSKYNEIMPEFFEQLNQAWKKWEAKPELSALLDQYFIRYSGDDDVPSQIHSHLSTNYKNLRNLPSDNPSLKSKAKDRWYVPDPTKNVDVEKLREKRLFNEFLTYLPPGHDIESVKKQSHGSQAKLPGMDIPVPKIPKGKRLKLVRTEAVRIGFKYCYQYKDYQTIIAVAHYIPEDVVQNDDQLQMIYDAAITRTGVDF